LEKKSLLRTSDRLGHRTSIHAIIFVGLSQAESVQSVAKILEDLRSNLSREIENIPAQILKDVFLNFQKMRELLISAGGGHIK
jgi:hypothetical protein